MCGIAGFTRFSTRWGDKTTLRTMGNRLRHRGPDASGEYLDENVGLSHRRLSIVDLSDAGRQPMISDDGQFIIVFNGEIYNFLELRAELEIQGYPFKSHTDTEVLLALYKLEGTSLLEKINGMFAFAIWDKSAKQLFLARDRIGKKPLYYHVRGNDVVFASELKALLTLKQIPKQIRLDAVYDYFTYQYIPDPKSIFNDIFKLEPGHYLTVSVDSVNKQQYWDLPFENSRTGGDSELANELLNLIRLSTERRLISDVPLGAFLSGGIDSSGIVALMAESSKSPVTTCSVGFDDEHYNETEFAQLIANQYRTDHHQFTVHENVNDSIEKIVSYFDEPFADPSLVPTYFVSKLARQRVTVALAGDGGDEVFAGYEKYRTDYIENRLRNIFPQRMRERLFPLLAKLICKIKLTPFRKAKSLLNSLSQDPAMGFFISNSQISNDLWRQLVKPNIGEKLGSYDPSSITTNYYYAAQDADHVARILYTDLKTYLPGDILVKVDRMSMANSLEVRAPILDKDVLEFMATIPSSFKLRKGEKKYLLKKAFHRLLPEKIISRRKMGFSVPLAEWLRHELHDFAEDRLLHRAKGLGEIFNMDVVKRLWNEHQEKSKDNATVLWSMLMYQLWWDEYISPGESS